MPNRRKERVLIIDPGLSKFVEVAVRGALKEDIHDGDITTLATVPARRRGVARIIAKEPVVVAGQFIAERVFKELNDSIKYTALVPDGKRARKGEPIAEITGNLRAILTGERVALNFLQRISGIATLTAQYVKRAGPGVMVLDTRKTTPCLRLLERYAVLSGGGVNHRFGLYDAVLIKENHIAAAGGVSAALKKARKAYPDGDLEIETRTLKEVKEALGSGSGAGADTILLDNMDIDKLKKAVALIDGRAITEASGGVRLDTIGDIAATGVDAISVGALTHSARVVDLSLLVKAL